MAKLEISKAYIVHGCKETDDGRLVGEELAGFPDLEIENLRDVLSLKENLQGGSVEAPAPAFFTGDPDVREELHFNLAGPLPFS